MKGPLSSPQPMPTHGPQTVPRVYYTERAVADFEARRLTHPKEADPERDVALVVQMAHEAMLSTTHRELSGATWMMATTGAFRPEWIMAWRLPAVSVVYDYADGNGRTYYLVHRVFYDGAAVRAVVALNALTALT